MMIEHMAKGVSDYFIHYEIIKPEDKDVYEYSFQLLISMVINCLIILCISIASGTFIQCLVYNITFVILRKTAGGFHAETHLGCCCILGVVMSGFVLFIKFFPKEQYNIVCVGSIIFSIFVVLLFAPIEHKNKPIKSEDKIRLKKMSVVYVILFSIIVIALHQMKFYYMMASATLGMFTACSSILVAAIQSTINRREGRI